ncbi:hypothetical protein Vretifemale_13271 [Volvox reticuliferus]|uniref:Uncharacterized protein n=1 Tax=Volvox reticuliferus TaxID=1737510 RepID=A0A8J4FUC5_9CHLO|nr:hypothetical protein Vretifemale_13271 [Volvox reticuliferus]
MAVCCRNCALHASICVVHTSNCVCMLVRLYTSVYTSVSPRASFAHNPNPSSILSSFPPLTRLIFAADVSGGCLHKALADLCSDVADAARGVVQEDGGGIVVGAKIL